MAFLRISVIPIGTATSSVGDYVANAVRLLEDESADYVLTDMGTIIEGKAAELLQLASKLHETPFKKGIKRVLTTIEIDDRRDKNVHLQDKIISIKKRLT